MKATLKEMNTQLTNKAEDKAIKTSDKLEENWSLFEDGVKDNYKNLYERVEAPLGTIQAAVKVKPLDAKTITTASTGFPTKGTASVYVASTIIDFDFIINHNLS